MKQPFRTIKPAAGKSSVSSARLKLAAKSASSIHVVKPNAKSKKKTSAAKKKSAAKKSTGFGKKKSASKKAASGNRHQEPPQFSVLKPDRGLDDRSGRIGFGLFRR